MHDQSNYSRWSWIVALIIGLILLLMLLAGKGPGNTCCQTSTEAPLAMEAAPTEDAPTVVTEAFTFSASAEEFLSNGNISSIDWLNDLDALKAMLVNDFRIEGDADSVTLTGSASSEGIKQQKGAEAEAFFGPNVIVDNQITVTSAETASPSAAILYFESGVHRLPADSQEVLEPIIQWLNKNADAKAVISGFHDQTGDLSSNQKLAKKRAESAYDALVKSGIASERIEMRKPVSTEGEGDLSEARRVEVTVE